MCVLTIVSTDKILRFKNIFIIIKRLEDADFNLVYKNQFFFKICFFVVVFSCVWILLIFFFKER